MGTKTDSNCLLIAIFTVFFLSIASLVISFITLFVWNVFLHQVVGLKEITWLQAFALTLLIGVITTTIKAIFTKD